MFVLQWGVKNINATNPGDVFIMFFLVKFAVLFSLNRAGGAGSGSAVLFDLEKCICWAKRRSSRNQITYKWFAPEPVGNVQRCSSCSFCHGVYKPLLNRAGALYFCTLCYTVYRKEGTRVTSVNIGTCRLLDDQNKGSAVNVRN